MRIMSAVILAGLFFLITPIVRAEDAPPEDTTTIADNSTCDESGNQANSETDLSASGSGATLTQ